MDKNNGRNLITAILAFQSGMIKSGQLLEAIRTWIKDKNRDLCDILVDQQAIDSDARDLLVAIRFNWKIQLVPFIFLTVYSPPLAVILAFPRYARPVKRASAHPGLHAFAKNSAL